MECIHSVLGQPDETRVVLGRTAVVQDLAEVSWGTSADTACSNLCCESLGVAASVADKSGETTVVGDFPAVTRGVSLQLADPKSQESLFVAAHKVAVTEDGSCVKLAH